MSARILRVAVALSGLITTTACGSEVMNAILFGPTAVAPDSTVREATPTPSPTPTPVPTVPNPYPTPRPTPTPGPGGHFPNNNSPVVAVHAKVFFVECDGTPVQGTEYASSASTSCRVHLDSTPRDVANNHTRAIGGPSWYVDGAKLNNPSSYTPVMSAKSQGTAVAYCYIDGVRSNDVVVNFY